MCIRDSLKVEQGHIKGTISNRTPWQLERVTLQAGSSTTTQGGERSVLADLLAPGATVSVDAVLVAPGAANLPGLKGSGQPVTDPTVNGGATTAPTDKKAVVLGVGLYQAQLANPTQYSLVAVGVPATTLQVDGRTPSRSSLAALVAPVEMESIDVLPAVRQARIVSSYTILPRYVDVYDLEIPNGVGGALKLSYSLPPATSGTPPVSSIEVYDWTEGTWTALPRQGGQAAGAVSLQPGQVLGGVARVRVVESNALSAGGSLKLVPGP